MAKPAFRKEDKNFSPLKQEERGEHMGDVMDLFAQFPFFLCHLGLMASNFKREVEDQPLRVGKLERIVIEVLRD